MFKSNERLLLFISFVIMLVLIGGMSIGVLAVENTDEKFVRLSSSPIIYEEPEETSTVIEVVDAHVTESNHVTESKVVLPNISNEEMIAKVVHTEAKGEGLIGKVAVAITILNRCDYYGETVETTITKENQYAYDETTEYGADSFRAVIIAEFIKDFIPDLFPETMMWFKPNGYHTDKYCGKPYIQIGNHYFNYLPESEE